MIDVRPHGRVAFLPYAPITLKALKSRDTDDEPSTLGEHVTKRRRELKISQKVAAERLGISWRTVLNWEKGRTKASVESIPTIIEFLCYDPSPKPANLSEQLAEARRAMGWTIKEAARRLGIDPGTWARWEKTGVPWKRHRAMLEVFLAALRMPTIGRPNAID